MSLLSRPLNSGGLGVEVLWGWVLSKPNLYFCKSHCAGESSDGSDALPWLLGGNGNSREDTNHACVPNLELLQLPTRYLA